MVDWRADLYSAYMSVSAILVITLDSYLDHECPEWLVLSIFERDTNPTGRFTQFHLLNIAQIIEVVASTDRQSKENTKELWWQVIIKREISYAVDY